MAEYVFKTVYFPGERVRRASSARVTVSIPTNHGARPEFLSFVSNLSSRGFRLAIGDPFIEDLEAQAQNEGRSLSNVCLRLLQEHFSRQFATNSDATGPQLPFSFLGDDVSKDAADDEPQGDLGVTFRDTLRQGVFGWYPYVEGFSATYTRDAILRYKPRVVYDPFGGSGTTQFAASQLGIQSLYSEINPFMSFVAETKVHAAAWARGHQSTFEDACESFLKRIARKAFKRAADKVSLRNYHSAFPERDFFEEDHLRQLLAAMSLAHEYESVSKETRDILLLACAANAVRSSNMTRRADLRRRRPDEYKNRVVDVPAYLSETVRRFVEDVRTLPRHMASTKRVSDDARELPEDLNAGFEFALTSPPYLNGTNYFRNTKIELWLLNFIESENDLGAFRRRAIAAGINNVTRTRTAKHTFESVEAVVERLERTEGDKRIPLLVRQYCSDMFELFAAVHRGLTHRGTFLLDIGDSKFYGVHVPTDHLLTDAAISAGLELKHRHVLARRHSRDKSELIQVELVFEKATPSSKRAPAKTTRSTSIAELAAKFQRELGYKQPPFNKRNWGHPLHSLCSYQGKLKPSMAHWLIREFVPSGGRVLDPLGGVGTIPFEAALQGHVAVSNDKSPFASTVARAKLNPPSLADAEEALESLWAEAEAVTEDAIDFTSVDFGLNGTVRDFFHPDTLLELLRARTVFLHRKGQFSVPEAFLWASLLHVLHGNRPYALSRTSHPITPFHPKGPAIYKSVREKVWARVVSALETPLPASFLAGDGRWGDFRDLNQETTGKFDAIITSPPFMGMRFDRPNWLRLWFCGWGESDFHNQSLSFLERQQAKSTDCYKDFFATMRGLIRDHGLLIMHIGSGGSEDLVGDLKRLAGGTFSIAAEVVENVQAIEQHGIRDKGLTTHHHLVFFRPA